MKRILLIAVLILIPTVSCRDRVLSSSALPPVIIISIDTLRSDHLPVYGYRGVDTPHIDALRKDSILYERAYSHVPLTLPSHATILTGLLPSANGIRDNLGFSLRADVATIPAILKTAGYRSAAAVSAFVLRGETGLNRGFDTYDDDVPSDPGALTLGNLQRAGWKTEAAAEKWLERQPNDGKPFFLLLHLYEPHTPYEPPEPFRSRYASKYDGEIAAADDAVGKLLDFLHRQKLYDRSLIILLSDHGEGLGDHGEEEHGVFLYREAIQVPLLMKLPGEAMAGRSVSRPVELIDVAPTVLGAAGVAVPSAMKGRSLIASAEQNGPARPIYSESYYARYHFGWSDLHSLISDRHQYIQAPRPELFDLSVDPRERTNVLDSNRRLYAELKDAISGYVTAAQKPTEIDAEDAKKLAALGYLGSGAKDSAVELADPKDKVATVRKLKLAFGLVQDQKDVEALPVLDDLLTENPRMLDVWDMKARSLAHLHRYAEAIEAGKRALAISPSTTHLAVLVGNLSLELGRLDDARKHAELAEKGDPGQAHDILARVALARGDLHASEKEARLSLASRHDQATALLTLARIEKERKNYAGALTFLDQAETTLKEKGNAAIPTLYFHRGDVLARLGKPQEAEAAFRREISLFPTEAEPYRNLILLLVTEGHVDEATALIFELEKAAPGPPAYLAIVQTLRTIGDSRGAKYWTQRGLKRFPADPNLQKLAAG